MEFAARARRVLLIAKDARIDRPERAAPATAMAKQRLGELLSDLADVDEELAKDGHSRSEVHDFLPSNMTELPCTAAAAQSTTSQLVQTETAPKMEHVPSEDTGLPPSDAFTPRIAARTSHHTQGSAVSGISVTSASTLGAPNSDGKVGEGSTGSSVADNKAP